MIYLLGELACEMCRWHNTKFRFHNEIFQIVKGKKKPTGYWKKSSPLPTRLANVKGNKRKEKCTQYINTSCQVGNVRICATKKIKTELNVNLPNHCPFLFLVWNNNAK